MSVTDISGKVIAITGASSGIGEATARLLAQQGAHVFLAARRADRLAALAAEIGATAVEVDVARREDLARLVDTAVDRHGRLDVLVASAGYGPIAPLDTVPVEDWDQMIDVNLRGVLHGFAAALPLFRAQKSGQFVTVASTSAHRIVPGQGVYAATKTAVRVVCECLRQESAGDFRVTVVSPGVTDTPFIPAGDDPVIQTYRDIAMPPVAVARAIAYAIEQPADIDVGEVIIRPTVQA